MRGNQYELARVLFLEKLALCVRYPFEGKRLRYKRPLLTALNLGNEAREDWLVPRGAANQQQIL